VGGGRAWQPPPAARAHLQHVAGHQGAAQLEGGDLEGAVALQQLRPAALAAPRHLRRGDEAQAGARRLGQQQQGQGQGQKLRGGGGGEGDRRTACLPSWLTALCSTCTAEKSAPAARSQALKAASLAAPVCGPGACCSASA
jgi:hypothetical protein